MTFRPKFVTFDCYGTLINFDMAGAARRIYSAQLSPELMAAFIRSFSAFRLDEVLGAWKPYAEVVHNALERTCRRHAVPFRPEDALRIYNEVPTWGPHPDVPAGLAKLAQHIPLVILSNAMNSQIMSNVEKLGAPFYRVITAEEVGILVGASVALLTGWSVLDPATAALVALHVLLTGLRVLWSAVRQLMDEVPPPETLQMLQETILSNATGATEVHDLRARQAGASVFAEFHLVVPAQMTVDRAHEICDRIEAEVAHVLPACRLNIHVEPDQGTPDANSRLLRFTI